MRSLPALMFRAIRIGLFATILITSCKKDPYQVGLDLLPSSDTLYVDQFDTVTIIAYSEIEDSVRSDEMTSILLGSIMDPVFGKTTASFYSQFLLSSEAIDFGVNAQLDSLVLILYYQTVYGDTNTLQNIRVFEMSEGIVLDSSYYSNQSVSTYGIELADLYYKPHPKDSLTIWGKKVAPHLRINLTNHTNYLGNKILQAPNSVLSTSAEFIKFMKGLYIQAVPVNSGGALVNYAAADGLSKMVLYFHNEDQGDSLHYDMPIDIAATRFSTFDHNGYLEASPEFKQQVLYHDTTLGKNRVYLQALGGVKIRIRLPYIKELKKLGTIAINNAILSFTNPEADTTFIPPPQLSLYRVDSAGRYGAIPDELEGPVYFGGAYDKDSRGYFFRVTRYLQQLMLNDTLPNYDLFVFASSPLRRDVFTNRVILDGTDPFFLPDVADRIRLKIVYTKLQ
ncbi:MAG: DUF4270 domain-containing protein [bacterium]